MGLTELRTFQFRNLSDELINFDSSDVFFVGENGQGKSNLLESVYFLCTGASFRTHDAKLGIRNGSKEMAVQGKFTVDSWEKRVVKFKLESGRKSIELDGNPLKDRKDLIYSFPCIVFSHGDMQFVNGPPERARWFFDQAMSLHDPRYLDSLRRYRTILKARNAVLKSRDLRTLDTYDIQLAETGLALMEQRRKTVLEFSEVFADVFLQVSGLQGTPAIRYKPSWSRLTGLDEVVAALSAGRESDRILGTSGSGPHRDRYGYYLDSIDFAKFASTGQSRLLGLALRIAQARYFFEQTGTKPYLLLDDVLLELDQARRERFVPLLPEYEQAFFTFLPDEPYDRYRNSSTQVLRVDTGRVLGG